LRQDGEIKNDIRIAMARNDAITKITTSTQSIFIYEDA